MPPETLGVLGFPPKFAFTSAAISGYMLLFLCALVSHCMMWLMIQSANVGCTHTLARQTPSTAPTANRLLLHYKALQ